MALRGTLTHRKTRKLATLLDIEVPCALGMVEALWHVTAEQAPAGNIGKLSNQDIAMEMFYTKDANSLIEAFVEAGWIDANDTHRLVTHDWSVFADDATDLRVARNHGGHYADGKPARMKRLSKQERAEIVAHNEQQNASVPRRATKGPEKTLPVSVSGPEPVSEPEPAPDPGSGSKSKPTSPSRPKTTQWPKALAAAREINPGTDQAIIEQIGEACLELDDRATDDHVARGIREKTIPRQRGAGWWKTVVPGYVQACLPGWLEEGKPEESPYACRICEDTGRIQNPAIRNGGDLLRTPDADRTVCCPACGAQALAKRSGLHIAHKREVA